VPDTGKGAEGHGAHRSTSRETNVQESCWKLGKGPLLTGLIGLICQQRMSEFMCMCERSKSQQLERQRFIFTQLIIFACVCMYNSLANFTLN